MKETVFETTLLPDGHLHCPHEIAQKKNAHFKVIVIFKKMSMKHLRMKLNYPLFTIFPKKKLTII